MILYTQLQNLDNGRGTVNEVIFANQSSTRKALAA